MRYFLHSLNEWFAVFDKESQSSKSIQKIDEMNEISISVMRNDVADIFSGILHVATQHGNHNPGAAKLPVLIVRIHQ